MSDVFFPSPEVGEQEIADDCAFIRNCWSDNIPSLIADKDKFRKHPQYDRFDKSSQGGDAHKFRGPEHKRLKTVAHLPSASRSSWCLSVMPTLAVTTTNTTRSEAATVTAIRS